MLLYFQPLGASNHKGVAAHPWGNPLHAFWCCYGSGVESMAKLADSLFFWRCAAQDHGTLPTCMQVWCQLWHILMFGRRQWASGHDISAGGADRA